ncbi:M23/M56 family metallopeptidase [Pseudoalteromonas sp. SMS1]|uniref:M23/M56 family metallopeptidase n=1 Tax=Pseudoalteromonas sp. SMS1 TaxID=2908894 RepID=UPI001F3EFB49|nr:M23/M56 family metallopeptidase [Pseudoalteromonas sp. SMS1]MCF2860468.1 M23/M56 family metallopeptidase [Pseudoalteromonas sp. SMS1]
MVWSTFIGLISVVLLWVFVSGVLFYTAKRMSIKFPAFPRLWWCVLALTTLPIVPLGMDSLEGSVPKVLLEVEGYVEHSQIKFSHAYANSMNIDTQDLPILILAIVLGVGIYRLVRLGVNWYKLAKHLSMLQSISLPWSNTPCIELPVNTSPFVFGLFKPRVVIPDYFKQLDLNQQKSLIYHELTHIRYKDHIAIVMWRVLSSLFWFNPFVRKMEQAFIGAMECRCDQATVTTYLLNKQRYAATLLAILKRSVAVTDVAGAAHFSSDALTLEDYKSRLKNIVAPEPNQPILLILSLLCICIVLVTLNIKAAPFVRPDDRAWHNPMRDFKISSHYGHISQFRNMKPHGGIDLVAPKGSPIAAIADGYVLVADDTTLPDRFGKVVLLQHNNGYQSLYAHLDSIDVEKGQAVQGGAPLGTLGETGRVTGPHLHLELIHKAQRLNPLAVLDLK